MTRFLQNYFWFSALAFVTVSLWPFIAHSVFGFWTGLDAVFILVFAGPLLALNTLATNFVLLSVSSSKEFWKATLVCQLVLYSVIAYMWYAPSSSEIEEKRVKTEFQKANISYLGALRRHDFAMAESIYAEAVEKNPSDFPSNAACLAAESAPPDTLAFSLKLQQKFSKRLAERRETPCNVIGWAIVRGEVDIARVAIENGEVFLDTDLPMIASASCCGGKQFTEEQRISLYRLAVAHHFVSREQMQSLLREAVLNQFPLLVRAIVEGAGGPDGLPDKGGNAMQAATRYGWKGIEELLKLGVDIDAAMVGPSTTTTALVEAIDTEHADRELVSTLLEHGASVKPPGGRSPFALALSHCNIPIATLLLARGADAKAPDPSIDDSSPPLVLAIKCSGDSRADHAAVLDLARKLLKRGANPNPKLDETRYLLPLLCVQPDPDEDAIKLLKAAGASINVRDGHGRTALMLDSGDEPEVVARLVACGIDVNAKDRQGRTAFDYLKEHGYGRSLQSLCIRATRPPRLCRN